MPLARFVHLPLAAATLALASCNTDFRNYTGWEPTSAEDLCGQLPALQVAATWSPALPSTIAPSSRASSSLAVLDGELILFGGGTLLSGALNDTWRRNLATDLGWSVAGANDRPSPRAGHGLIALGDELLLVGGQAQNPLADTWSWVPAGWTEVCSDDAICSEHPSGRFGHALSFDSQRGVVVLMGGHDNDRSLNDVWEWSRASGWVERRASDCLNDGGPCDGPRPRYDHALAFDSDRARMVLFGGADDDPVADALWEHDGVRWVSIRTSGDVPSGRSGHVMAYLPNHRLVVVYGGASRGALVTDDLWVYSPSEGQWLQPDVLGTRPPTRAFASAAYDVGSDRLAVFGGGLGGELADLWFLQLMTERPRERCRCSSQCSAACGIGSRCEKSCRVEGSIPTFDCSHTLDGFDPMDAGAESSGLSTETGVSSFAPFDLVLSAIEDPGVDCLLDQCVTAATVVIDNMGSGTSTTFEVIATLDANLRAYGAGDTPIPPGESRRVVFASEPGADCLDPTCEICATIVADGDVNVENNTRCQSFTRASGGN